MKRFVMRLTNRLSDRRDNNLRTAAQHEDVLMRELAKCRAEAYQNALSELQAAYAEFREEGDV